MLFQYPYLAAYKMLLFLFQWTDMIFLLIFVLEKAPLYKEEFTIYLGFYLVKRLKKVAWALK